MFQVHMLTNYLICSSIKSKIKNQKLTIVIVISGIKGLRNKIYDKAGYGDWINRVVAVY